MKAYEVPRGTWINLEEDAAIPPDAPGAGKGMSLKVLNLDGMYVNCVDKNDVRHYIAAWTDVTPL